MSIKMQKISFSTVFVLTALIMSLVIGEMVHADDGDSPIQMSEVTVIGSKEEIRNLPGSGAFLSREEIGTHNYSDVNRILRQVPGIYLREEDGNGLFPNISLRGVDSGRSGKVTLMEDGILAAPAPYSAPSAYYSPTAGRMNGLEVLKGSSQIKYGPHTTGGVINYLSTPIPNESEIFAKTSIGNFNESKTHAHIGNTIGKIGYLIETNLHQSDGFKKIDVPEKSDTGFRKHDALLKFSFDPNPKNQISAKIGYTDLNANETYLGLSDSDFEIEPYQRYAASRFDNIKSDQLQSYLRYRSQITDDLRLTFTGYYSKFHRDWFKLRAKGSDLAEPDKLAVLKGEKAGTLKYRNNNRDYDLGGADAKANYDLKIAEIENDLEIGVRYHQDQVRRFQRDVAFSQDDNGNIINREDQPWGSGGNRLQETSAISVFAQDQIRKGPIEITPGFRYETINYRYIDYKKPKLKVETVLDQNGEEKEVISLDANGNPILTADPNEIDSEGEATLSVFAPGIGMNLELSKSVSMFGGVHSGYSVPSPRSFVKSQSKNDGAIKEERSIGSEIGIRFDRQVFRAEVVGFFSRFNDLIVPDNIGAGGGDRTENVGNVNSAGVELSIGYDLGVAKELGFRVPISGNLTFTDARLDGDASSADQESIFSNGKDGNFVPYIPQIQFAASVGIEAHRGGIFVNAHYVSDTFTTANNLDLTDPENINFGKTDAYLIIDLSAKYRLIDGISMFVNLKNLTDQKYVVSRHPIGPRPGRPFSASIGLETKF